MASPEVIAAPVKEESAYGTNFEGFAEEHESPEPVSATGAQSTASRNLAEAKRLAEAGGLLGKKVSDKGSPNDLPQQGEDLGPGPFLRRMTEFRDWLRAEIQIEEFILMDGGGGILVDQIVEEETKRQCRILCDSLPTAGQGQESISPSLSLQSQDGKIIEILAVMTHYGGMILGLLAENRIPPVTVAMVREGLKSAVHPPNFPEIQGVPPEN